MSYKAISLPSSLCKGYRLSSIETPGVSPGHFTAPLSFGSGSLMISLQKYFCLVRSSMVALYQIVPSFFFITNNVKNNFVHKKGLGTFLTPSLQEFIFIFNMSF
nr:MAG TPA: hypothetical protein [Caudoviricetes sp.]